MTTERYYTRLTSIENQMKKYNWFSPDWNALEKQRMKTWTKICELTNHKGLQDNIRKNARFHLEGTLI